MPFGFGRGGRPGHGRRHRMHRSERINENCICPACNTIVAHQRGKPCFQTACPNCGAAMTRQFNTPEVTNSPEFKSESPKPVVAANFCTGCGKCLPICAFEAIEIIEQKAIINPEACTNCRACIPVCPVSAIH